jgi:hypothetical protein
MRIDSDPNWHQITSYSASPNYAWDSTGAQTGKVWFGVWVRDVSNPTVAQDAYTSIAYWVYVQACSSVTLSASPAAPQRIGTQITFTASASRDCPKPRYEFWMLVPGSSTWQLVQAYSSSATYQWNSSGAAPGAPTFSVWVEDASSTGQGSNPGMGTYDTYAGMSYYVG